MGQKSLVFEKLSVQDEESLFISVLDAVSGETLCEAGPLIIRDGIYGGYWGDLHGQSGETIGINNSREYFDFARDLAFLDVTSHQTHPSLRYRQRFLFYYQSLVYNLHVSLC